MEKYSTKENETYREHAEKAVHKAEEHGQKARHNLQENMQKLKDAGVAPCGLGARDSLRLEMCYPLNGSDLSPDKTPLEAGLGFFCALDTDFIPLSVDCHPKNDRCFTVLQ